MPAQDGPASVSCQDPPISVADGSTAIRSRYPGRTDRVSRSGPLFPAACSGRRANKRTRCATPRPVHQLSQVFIDLRAEHIFIASSLELVLTDALNIPCPLVILFRSKHYPARYPITPPRQFTNAVAQCSQSCRIGQSYTAGSNVVYCWGLFLAQLG